MLGSAQLAPGYLLTETSICPDLLRQDNRPFPLRCLQLLGDNADGDGYCSGDVFIRRNTILSGVSAAHVSSDRVNANAVAENMARNQMEYVNSLAYVAPPGNYASVADGVCLNVNIPTGFAVSAGTETYVADDGYTGSIEKVVVTVTRDGQSILVLESLRSGP